MGEVTKKEELDIIQQLLKPFVEKILTHINNKEYFEIYFFSILFLIIVAIFIFLSSYFLSNKRVKSELKKNNEDRKEKQISNFEKLLIEKEKYLDQIKEAQTITRNVISYMKTNDIVNVKNSILSCRQKVFNDLLQTFDNYLELFSIVHEGHSYKFKELFLYEYKNLMDQLDKLLSVINNETVLKKCGIKFYFINEITILRKFHFMKNHLPKLSFNLRYQNKIIYKKFTKKYSKKF